MSEVKALDRHDCPACGAAAVWNPTRQILACPYCGTEAPLEEDAETGVIREIDLVKTLRELGEDERGWQEARHSVQCQSCKAVQVFEAERVGQKCEFCGSPALVDYEEIRSPIRPQGILPFKINRETVRKTLRDWLKGRWFAPGGLARKALVDEVHGVYLPYWTFDAQVSCPWTAMSGTYYYTTERVRLSNGKIQTRRKRHVRWRPAAGHVDHAFDDTPVPGTKGVDRGLLAQVEPFRTTELEPYDTRFLQGFVVEHYQVVLIEAHEHARRRMNAELERLCAAQIPGDTYRNLVIRPEYSGQTFKHVLVPLWLLTYQHRGRPFQVLVNGWSGRLAGRYPKSWWKIGFAVLGAASVLGTLILIARFL